MRWYVLVHQIPPSPPYLRAKVGQRLARVGALPIKNSVYLLPFQPDCLEDFQWIAKEAEAGGGEAVVLEARFTANGEAEAAVRRFQTARQTNYRALTAELRALVGRTAVPASPRPARSPGFAAGSKRSGRSTSSRHPEKRRRRP